MMRMKKYVCLAVLFFLCRNIRVDSSGCAIPLVCDGNLTWRIYNKSQTNTACMKNLVNDMKKSYAVEMKEIEDNVHSMGNEIDKLKDMLESLKKQKIDLTIKYRGHFFTIEIGKGEPSITFPMAQVICEDIGGYPANIYSLDHYRMIVGRIRSLMGDSNAFSVYIGMKYNENKSELLNYGGSPASFAAWGAKEPSMDVHESGDGSENGSGDGTGDGSGDGSKDGSRFGSGVGSGDGSGDEYTPISLVVLKDESSSDNGMRISLPEWLLNGVVCMS